MTNPNSGKKAGASDLSLSRRHFVGAAAAVAAFTYVPKRVLGQAGGDSANNKLNIAEGWGRLAPQAAVFRHWLSVMAGAYATHGECYVTETNKRDTFFMYGGTIAGEGSARLTFLKEIVDALPFHEMEPNQGLGNRKDRFCLSKGDELLLFLLTEQSTDRRLDFAVAGKESATYDVTVYDAWKCSIVDQAAGVRGYDASTKLGLIVVKATKSESTTR